MPSRPDNPRAVVLHPLSAVEVEALSPSARGLRRLLFSALLVEWRPLFSGYLGIQDILRPCMSGGCWLFLGKLVLHLIYTVFSLSWDRHDFSWQGAQLASLSEEESHAGSHTTPGCFLWLDRAGASTFGNCSFSAEKAPFAKYPGCARGYVWPTVLVSELRATSQEVSPFLSFLRGTTESHLCGNTNARTVAESPGGLVDVDSFSTYAIAEGPPAILTTSWRTRQGESCPTRQAGQRCGQGEKGRSGPVPAAMDTADAPTASNYGAQGDTAVDIYFGGPSTCPTAPRSLHRSRHSYSPVRGGDPRQGGGRQREASYQRPSCTHSGPGLCTQAGTAGQASYGSTERQLGAFCAVRLGLHLQGSCGARSQHRKAQGLGARWPRESSGGESLHPPTQCNFCDGARRRRIRGSRTRRRCRIHGYLRSRRGRAVCTGSEKTAHDFGGTGQAHAPARCGHAEAPCQARVRGAFAGRSSLRCFKFWLGCTLFANVPSLGAYTAQVEAEEWPTFVHGRWQASGTDFETCIPLLHSVIWDDVYKSPQDARWLGLSWAYEVSRQDANLTGQPWTILPHFRRNWYGGNARRPSFTGHTFAVIASSEQATLVGASSHMDSLAGDEPWVCPCSSENITACMSPEYDEPPPRVTLRMYIAWVLHVQSRPCLRLLLMSALSAIARFCMFALILKLHSGSLQRIRSAFHVTQRLCVSELGILGFASSRTLSLRALCLECLLSRPHRS